MESRLGVSLVSILHNYLCYLTEISFVWEAADDNIMKRFVKNQKFSNEEVFHFDYKGVSHETWKGFIQNHFAFPIS